MKPHESLRWALLAAGAAAVAGLSAINVSFAHAGVYWAETAGLAVFLLFIAALACRK